MDAVRAALHSNTSTPLANKITFSRGAAAPADRAKQLTLALPIHAHSDYFSLFLSRPSPEVFDPRPRRTESLDETRFPRRCTHFS